jgi:hypothetical protein
MKYIRLLVFCCFCLFVIIPEVLTADTLKVHLTYKHRITAENRTSGYSTIKQKFFTPDDTLIREINYDENTSQISSYIFYFYNNKRLFTEECYSGNDSLMYIFKHDYDEAGNEYSLTRYKPGKEGIYVSGKTERVFNKNNKVITEDTWYGKKNGSVARYSYDEAGFLVSMASKFKPVSGSVYKSVTKTYLYDPVHRLKQTITAYMTFSKEAYNITEDYAYNDNGLLDEITVTDSRNKNMTILSYKYLPGGSLSMYQVADTSGKILELLQYDYKKHLMNIGTQVSYFDR